MELTPVFSVSELNEYVRLTLDHDENLSHLTVTGELSGFKRHSSGHLYFTLKDEQAQVRCAMFRSQAATLLFRPEDGMQVCIRGRAGLYPRDGSFQVYVNAMTREGDGELFRRFLLLKAELERKGYFDPDRKKRIPAMPRAIGVVTAETGAAIQDVRNVVARRFPGMPVVLYAAQVQGAGAARSVADAIMRADRERKVDVLIVGRGGGSLEDLWAFNELPVADAILACTLPVISAVGHETDVSIADFVADLRAPTPSAAAELTTPERREIEKTLSEAKLRLSRACAAGLVQKRERLERVFALAAALRVRHALDNEQMRLDRLSERGRNAAKERLTGYRNTLDRCGAGLSALDPERTLKRGFALVSGADGRGIPSSAETAVGESIRIRFFDGGVSAAVTGKDGDDGNV